jgi:Domain of unknown function (DUF4159)
MRRIAGAALALMLALASMAYAQRWSFREGSLPARFPTGDVPSNAFVFCRLMYQSVRAEQMGIGWRTDYPYAEINLMTRMSELTRAPMSFEAPHRPEHYVVRLTDAALFSCPFTMASDVGTIGLTDAEAANLRNYLLKGGFLWVDDFWGRAAWDQWSREIAKVLPPHEYPIVDVPLDDPLFRTMFQVPRVPQITNIQFWRGVDGATTSERGVDSVEAHLRAIRDSHGRIMVLMSHNTDIADAWEREGEDPEFFYRFSPDGYAVGINVLLHAMTH